MKDERQSSKRHAFACLAEANLAQKYPSRMSLFGFHIPVTNRNLCGSSVSPTHAHA